MRALLVTSFVLLISPFAGADRPTDVVGSRSATTWVARTKTACAHALSYLNPGSMYQRRYAARARSHNARAFYYEDQRIAANLLQHAHPREAELRAHAAASGYEYRTLGVTRDLYVRGEGLVTIGWGSAILVEPRTQLVTVIVIRNARL